jgi:outer membrane protein assembly factor BamA
VTIRDESRWLWAVLAAGLSTSTLLAQTPATGDAQTPPAGPAAQATTRLELFELARRQKDATLWPERESPMVSRVNGLMDRGLIEGIRTGEGNNGWQFLLSGTRPAQGQTFGVGYRRSDLFNDALTARVTARGTLAGAQLYDGELQVNSLRRSRDTFVNIYSKYERSPNMDYYGLGANSRKEDRSRYQLNTASIEGRAGYRFTRALNAGIDIGYGGAHTRAGNSDEVASIETKFDATTAPGLFDDTRFSSWGAFAAFDVRDLTRGPRSGGFYGIEFKRYVDMNAGTYSHRQLGVEGQHFFPYLNQQRVVALFVKARFAYTGRDDRVVPFYLLPTLGGNFELRGFNQYRFSDSNAFMAALEHRWYAFSGLEMALFVDAGKTVPEKSRIDFSGLNYSGGVGLRARVRGAVVLRMDVAHGREGTRWIWSISDVSRRRF